MLKKILYFLLIMAIATWCTFTLFLKMKLMEHYRWDFFNLVLFITCVGIFFILITHKHTPKSYEFAKKYRKLSSIFFISTFAIFVISLFLMYYYSQFIMPIIYVTACACYFSFIWMMYCFSENVKEDNDD